MQNLVKRLSKRVAGPFRSRLRPSFLIVGAQKAGTSALFETLAGHPSVIAPRVKEHDLFSHEEAYARGIDRYLMGFPLKPWKHEGQITFEASPSYLGSPEAPLRIQRWFPDMRIIILLRDPVKRAFSAWNMYRQFERHPKYGHRYDPRPFDVAIAEELRGGPYSGPIEDYLSRGEYAGPVQRYLETFGQERVLVLSHLTYRHDPKSVLDQVCRFVDLEPLPSEHSALRIKANERPYAHALTPEMKDLLYRHFAPHMAALRTLVGPVADLCEEPAYRALWSGEGSNVFA